MEIFNKAVNPRKINSVYPRASGCSHFIFRHLTIKTAYWKKNCDHIRKILAKSAISLWQKKEKETGFGYEDQTFLEINE